ncbi:MAG: 3-deoxy-manno-octulosonate cytidylyltransferase [Rickettsiales bacterium]|nr:3-deoxy-manno-octulosonate cytidylyltransferase [Rickettsiales bacterium]
MTNPIILIPARMASTRLPNKPMADIAGVPMIVQCYRRAQESKLARVVVACDSAEIAEAIAKEGGEAVLTDPDLPSGSDRIYAALTQVDAAGEHDIIVNLQGDMPTLDPSVIASVLEPLISDAHCDIATLAAQVHTDEERVNPAVVKVVIAQGGQALYFSRNLIPAGEGTHYHHIGIYAYRCAALERFVAMAPSPLEKREKLEQLRALEAGMKMGVSVVNTVPLGVDTPQQLEQARALLA